MNVVNPAQLVSPALYQPPIERLAITQLCQVRMYGVPARAGSYMFLRGAMKLKLPFLFPFVIHAGEIPRLY